MGEDGRAVAFHMLVEAQAKACLGQHTSKRGLAHLQRITPHVVAIQLDQVEGVEEYVLVGAVVTDEIERGNAVVIASAAHDSFGWVPSGTKSRRKEKAPLHVGLRTKGILDTIHFTLTNVSAWCGHSVADEGPLGGVPSGPTKEYALVSAVVANEIERRHAVVVEATASPSMMQERERRRASVSPQRHRH